MLNRTVRVTLAVALPLAAVSAAAQSANAAQTVAVTYECTSNVTVEANPGDTLILTAGSSCPTSGTTDDTEFYLMNLNGSLESPTGSEFPSGWTPGSGGWSGTATGAGFLSQSRTILSGFQGSANTGTGVTPDPWYAFYSQQGDSLQVTLESTDGPGNVLVAGSTIAAVYYYWGGGGTYPDGTTALIQLAEESSDDSNAPSPAPWLKAIGRAADAQCPEGMHPSWAMWPNNGTGGFTCEWREEYAGGFAWRERPGFYG